MGFDEKYKLLDLSEDENARTFAALEISTGRKVTVFLFPGDYARKQGELIERLQGAGRAQLPELIEIGNNRGTPYVVTEPMSRLLELKELVNSRLRAASPIPASPNTEDFSRAGVWRVPPELKSRLKQAEKPSVSAAPPGQPPAERPPVSESFAEIFQAPAAPIGEPALEAPKAPPTPAAPQPAAQPVPGEFTQMFQAPAAPIGEPALETPKEPPTPAVPTPPAAQPAPGEFTRFFSAAAVPAQAPQPPDAKGGFTRIFGSGDTSMTTPSPGTQMLGQGDHPAAGQQEPAPGAASPVRDRAYGRPAGEFTRLFGDAPSSGIPSAAPAPPPPAAQAAPGEYTRMFGTQVSPQEIPTEPAPAPISAPEKAVPAKQTSYLIPALIVVILLLLAAIAVILVATSK